MTNENYLYYYVSPISFFSRDKIDEYGRNALHYVAIDVAGPEQESEALRLISTGLDVNLPDKNGWTPLHFAAQEQSVPVVKALIESGAEIDAGDSFGNSPLFRVVFSSEGRGEVIRLLLEAGANPDSKNNKGVSPRSLAETIANYDVRQYFD